MFELWKRKGGFFTHASSGNKWKLWDKATIDDEFIGIDKYNHSTATQNMIMRSPATGQRGNQTFLGPDPKDPSPHHRFKCQNLCANINDTMGVSVSRKHSSDNTFGAQIWWFFGCRFSIEKLVKHTNSYKLGFIIFTYGIVTTKYQWYNSMCIKVKPGLKKNYDWVNIQNPVQSMCKV